MRKALVRILIRSSLEEATSNYDNEAATQVLDKVIASLEKLNETLVSLSPDSFKKYSTDINKDIKAIKIQKQFDENQINVSGIVTQTKRNMDNLSKGIDTVLKEMDDSTKF